MAKDNGVICNVPRSNFKLFLTACLRHWKIYTTHKLRRKLEIRKALYWYNVRLLQKALNLLSRNLIESKENSIRGTNYSTKWKKTSEEFRDIEHRNILKRAFRILYSHTVNARDRAKIIHSVYYKHFEKQDSQEKERKVDEFHRRTVLKRFFAIWKNQHGDGDLEKKWENATAHWRRKLFKRIWFAWTRYRDVKILRKNQIDEVRRFYVRSLLARCLKLLSMYACGRIVKRQRLRETASYHDKKLSMRIFRLWLNDCRAERELERKISVYRDAANHAQLRNALKQWFCWVHERKCSRRRKNVSRIYYERKLAAKGLASFREYLHCRRAKAIRLDYLKDGVARICLDILRVNVEQWRVSVVRIAKERQKSYCAEYHWKSRQIRRYFTFWKQFSQRYKSKAKRRNVLNSIGETVLLDKYMRVWYFEYKALERIRVKETQAASEYQKKIQSRVFLSWKSYKNEKILQRIEIQKACEFHKRLLLKEGLKKTLKSCLYKTEFRYEKQSIRAKKNVAEDFDMVKKYFTKWLEFVYADHREKKSTRFNSEKENRTVGEFSFAKLPTRLVLPEYMLKPARMDIRDDRDFARILKNNCKNNEEKKPYYSLSFGGCSSAENFSAKSENTSSEWTETYNIVKSIQNAPA